jgi:hypothetical protein
MVFGQADPFSVPYFRTLFFQAAATSFAGRVEISFGDTPIWILMAASFNW